MQIWAIGTTRNEVDLVWANVLHHVSQGIDKVLLLDNDSRDGTQDVLEDVAHTCPLEWSAYHGPFRQDLLLSELADRAFASGADWVIPIDADEFWCAPHSSIRRVLETSAARALRVQLVNFIQHYSQRYNTPDALLRMTRTVPRPIGPMERCEELVEDEEIAYVEHYYHYKWIHRTSPGLQIGWGNHTTREAPGAQEDADQIVCLHAPLRSFAVLQSKVDGERPQNEIDEYFGMAWHLRRWRRLAWEGRLEAEWRANSYLDDLLDVHGKLHPVVLDTRLYDLVKPWLNVTSAMPPR